MLIDKYNYMKNLFCLTLISSFLVTVLFATEKTPTAVDDYVKSLQLARLKNKLLLNKLTSRD